MYNLPAMVTPQERYPEDPYAGIALFAEKILEA
jgi:hypothetical protein